MPIFINFIMNNEFEANASNGKENKSCYIDQFRIIKTIGNGYQAEVYLVTDPDGKNWAIKRYKKQTSSIQTLRNQLNIMKDLNHQNIVKLFDVRQQSTYRKQDDSTTKCFALILQLIGGGQLYDLIAQSGSFSEKLTRTYFTQLINGLNYVHQKGYSHRDLKPQNILIGDDYVLKLSDFGLSCYLAGSDNSYVLHTKLGTEGYMAPEINLKSYDGIKIDIFSAGVILFIMFAGSPPFRRAASNDQFYKLIRQKRNNYFWKLHQKHRTQGFFNQNFRDLFLKLICVNPKQRLDTIQILEHPWMKGQICSQQQIKEQFTKRRQKVDQIKQQKKQAQQAQKIKTLNNIVERGQSLQSQQQNFLQLYLNEQSKQIQLKTLQKASPDDFIVNQNIAYILAQIKNNFKRSKIYLYNEQQLIDVDNQQFLIGQQISQNQGELQLTYKYDYEIEQKKLRETCEVLIKYGESKQSKQEDGTQVVVAVRHVSGDRIYFKKIARFIKSLFNYCLA